MINMHQYRNYLGNNYPHYHFQSYSPSLVDGDDFTYPYIDDPEPWYLPRRSPLPWWGNYDDDYYYDDDQYPYYWGLGGWGGWGGWGGGSWGGWRRRWRYPSWISWTS